MCSSRLSTIGISGPSPGRTPTKLRTVLRRSSSSVSCCSVAQRFAATASRVRSCTAAASAAARARRRSSCACLCFSNIAPNLTTGPRPIARCHMAPTGHSSAPWPWPNSRPRPVVSFPRSDGQTDYWILHSGSPNRTPAEMDLPGSGGITRSSSLVRDVRAPEGLGPLGVLGVTLTATAGRVAGLGLGERVSQRWVWPHPTEPGAERRAGVASARISDVTSLSRSGRDEMSRRTGEEEVVPPRRLLTPC